MVYIRIFCIECRKDKNRDTISIRQNEGSKQKTTPIASTRFFWENSWLYKNIVIQKI